MQVPFVLRHGVSIDCSSDALFFQRQNLNVICVNVLRALEIFSILLAGRELNNAEGCIQVADKEAKTLLCVTRF